MSDACKSFRARLERALRGRGTSAERSGLAWHEHLLGCAPCRDLLQAEEALEELLSSLPEPRLPAHLAQRVLVRLAAERRGTGDLDELLDLDAAPEPPPGLAGRVLDGLAAERRTLGEDAALDHLLELVPTPRAPEGLAARVLAGLEVTRSPARRAARPDRIERYAAAAVVLLAVGFLAWLAWRSRPAADSGGPTGQPQGPFVTEVEEPSDELLAVLDVLENWELVASEEVDIALAPLDPADEELYDILLESSLEEEEDEG